MGQGSSCKGAVLLWLRKEVMLNPLCDSTAGLLSSGDVCMLFSRKSWHDACLVSLSCD